LDEAKVELLAKARMWDTSENMYLLETIDGMGIVMFERRAGLVSRSLTRVKRYWIEAITEDEQDEEQE
jgi:hypothetical protein